MSSIRGPLPCAAYTGKEPYIFISYAHVDGDRVYPEIKALNDRGYRIWYDQGINPGSKWPDEIARAIAGCAIFIVFISQNAIQSSNVIDEVNFARNKNKLFLAVHLEDTTLPEGLELRTSRIQAVMKWRMPKDEYLQKIVKTLPSDCLEKSRQSLKTEPPPKVPVMRFPPVIWEKKSKPKVKSFIPMVRVPGAKEFPIGEYDSDICKSVNYPYELGKTPVTYGQWRKVFDWAIKHGYAFTFHGHSGAYNSGSEDHPVTYVGWREVMVWCNAMTERCNAVQGTNYTCAYYYEGTITRGAKIVSTCDKVEFNPESTGFRLPTSMEWELAARYINGKYWTPGKYPSGVKSLNETDIEAVAWYRKNSSSKTHPVGMKKPNALGIYDMSGNVYEWCFDRSKDSSDIRVKRGGCYDSCNIGLQLSREDTGLPYNLNERDGFRLARTL